MSGPSAFSSNIPTSIVPPNQQLAFKGPQLLPTTARPTGKYIVGVQFPFNGSPFLRKTINLMNIYDEIGIEHNWPEVVGWGIEPLRHIRAFLVSWHDPFLRLANGRYYVFGGDVHSGLPVNRYFEGNRYGLHGDVIVLKPASDGEMGPGRVEYMNVPEELLYPVTMAGFMTMINNMP